MLDASLNSLHVTVFEQILPHKDLGMVCSIRVLSSNGLPVNKHVPLIVNLFFLLRAFFQVAIAAEHLAAVAVLSVGAAAAGILKLWMRPLGAVLVMSPPMTWFLWTRTVA